MKDRIFARLAAGLLALSLMTAPVLAASDTGKAPAQTSEQKDGQAAPPAPQKPEPKKTEKESGSGAKQAGRDVANTFKKFGKDVGDFFDGLFN